MQFRKKSPLPATTSAAPPATTTSAGVSAADLPAFPELDEREALFVVEYVARSGTAGAGADAALAAGYSNNNRNAAHAMASKLLRRPAVLRALKDETGRRLATAAPLGVAVLENLARTARSEQVRLAAANSLIDRGYGPVVSRSASANLQVSSGLEELLEQMDREGLRPDSAGRWPDRTRGKERSGKLIDITPGAATTDTEDD